MWYCAGHGHTEHHEGCAYCEHEAAILACQDVWYEALSDEQQASGWARALLRSQES